MENASKALLMAGGMLIALILIALLVRSFTNISVFQQSQLTEEEQAQLVAFNEQYTKYLGQYVYGADVISVINRSFSNTNYKITTKIIFKTEYTYDTYEYVNGKKKVVTKTVRAGKTLNITNDDDIAIGVINNPEDSLKRRAFKCTNIGYDSNGRVNSIIFEEKEWGDLT